MANDPISVGSTSQTQPESTHTFQIAPSAFANIQNFSSSSIDMQALDLQSKQSVAIPYSVIDKGMASFQAPIKTTDNASYTEVQMGEMTYTNISDYIAQYGEFSFIFSNSEYEGAVCLAITSDVAGTYSAEDLLAPLNTYGFTYLNGPEGSIILSDLELSVVTGSREVDGYDYHVNLAMYSDENSCKYVTSFDYNYPYAASTVEFLANNLFLDDTMMDLFWTYFGYGWFEFKASNDDYTINGNVTTSTCSVEGTYAIQSDICNMVLTDNHEGRKYPANSGEISVSKTEDGYYLLTGKVLFSNNVELIITANHSELQPTRYETIKIDDARYIDYFYAGSFDLIAESNDRLIFMEICTTQFEGHYTLSDLWPNTNYISYLDEEGNKTKDYNRFHTVDINITANEDGTYSVTGTILAQDRHDESDYTLFTLDIVLRGLYYDARNQDYQEVFALSDAEIVKVEVSRDGTPIDYDAYLVDVKNENNAIAAMLFICKGESIMPGVYNIDRSLENMTVYQSKGINMSSGITYSFAGYMDGEYVADPAWFFRSGTVTVAENGMITVDAVNSCGSAISILIQDDITGIGINEINVVSDRVAKILKEGQLYIEHSGKTFNTQGVLIK